MVIPAPLDVVDTENVKVRVEVEAVVEGVNDERVVVDVGAELTVEVVEEGDAVVCVVEGKVDEETDERGDVMSTTRVDASTEPETDGLMVVESAKGGHTQTKKTIT